MSIQLEISVAQQKLIVLHNMTSVKEYSISTAAKGVGEKFGSEQTPRGWHIIRAKIGNKLPANTVFVGRRPTGEIYSPQLLAQFPTRDWILTRILWLSGLEVNKNRLREVDTMRRYIYIHGSPSHTIMGVPGSHGCVRMRNEDVIDLFDNVPVYTKILIT